MSTLLEFSAVLFVGIIPSFLSNIFYIKHPNYGERFSNAELLLKRWVSSLSQISVVLLIASNQPAGLSSVGLGVKYDSSISCMSMLAFVLFLNIPRIIRKLRGKQQEQQLDLTRPHIKEIQNYRHGTEQLVLLVLIPLGAIAEEFVFHGYLVLLMGTKTGTYMPWVILSIILTVSMHLYQGASFSLIGWHFVLEIFFLALVLITQSIELSMLLHTALNVGFIFSVWQLARQSAIRVEYPELATRTQLMYLVFFILTLVLLAFIGLAIFTRA